MSNTIKVTISGSYRSANRQIESFDGVTGLMPNLDEDKATQMAIRRYARIWIPQVKKDNGDSKYLHVSNIRQVSVDSIEDNEDNPNAVLSYVGKDILEMSFEDLQDLAAANDLSGIPLYKIGSLFTARRMAWSEYAIKVLQLEEYAPTDKKEKFNLYDHRSPGFNPKRFEPIIADGEIRRHDKDRQSLEEGIESVSEPVRRKGGKPVEVESKGSRMTLAQLKMIAKQRNVAFNPAIGYDVLFKRVYGKSAEAE